MMAYLAMMAPRLVELRRVLKPTGSIYLHCDPTASHYLKLLMDAVFGPENFRNEIVWKRSMPTATRARSSALRAGPRHASLLSRGVATTRGTRSTRPYDEEYVRPYYRLGWTPTDAATDQATSRAQAGPPRATPSTR